jgi:hypothetical protein
MYPSCGLQSELRKGQLLRRKDNLSLCSFQEHSQQAGKNKLRLSITLLKFLNETNRDLPVSLASIPYRLASAWVHPQLLPAFLLLAY